MGRWAENEGGGEERRRKKRREGMMFGRRGSERCIMGGEASKRSIKGKWDPTNLWSTTKLSPFLHFYLNTQKPFHFTSPPLYLFSKRSSFAPLPA